jgi:hypothetical protein
MLVYQRVIYDIPLDHHELAGLIPYEITIQQTRFFSSVCTLFYCDGYPDTLVAGV